MLLDELRWQARRAGWPALYRLWLEHAVAFDITPVFTYVHGRVQRGDFVDGLDVMRELPNVAPLADVMYLEFAAPTRSGRQAVILVAGEVPAGDLSAGEARWGIAAFTLGHVPPSERASPCYTREGFMFYVRADGSICAEESCRMGPDEMTLEPTTFEEYTDEERRTLSMHRGVAFVALTAVCFAHCKGVRVADHVVPRQQRRAAERAGRPPLVTYKTIDIAPVTRVLRDEGQIEKTGLKKALHITRGHFAHYTQDAPLFGKYTGTFFRPMHLRGTASAGVSLHDYRVLADEKTPPRDGV
jgi:hypothetical protein